jgi:hypothetical protein
MDNNQYRQQQDMEAREWALLEALQKIDRAGLQQEALLLAWESGVLTAFRKELEMRRKT